MIGEGEKILVGFSGGADSVCLLHVLYRMGYDVCAAHLNHNMRPTAERDLKFCAEFCKMRGIPFFSKTMPQGKLKNENSARSARYEFFYETMSENGIELLATAHNKDDSAETVLLHMLRGAALEGLCGIAPKDGRLIRPLIFAKKKDIIAYCCQNGLRYMTDETNLTDAYSRNKLRNRFIPELAREFNPSLIDGIADNARVMAQDSDFLKSLAQAEFEKLYSEADGICGVDTVGLVKLHNAVSSRVLQLLWRKNAANAQNLPRIYINAIYDLAKSNKSGSRLDLPNGMCAVVCYGRLDISRKSRDGGFCYGVDAEEWCEIPEAGIRLMLSASGSGQRICLDGGEKIIVRSRKPGDSFSPAGMSGTKKISDYMIDEKIPVHMRDKLPLLCVNGEIAAVVGKRCSAGFASGRYVYYIKTEPADISRD